MLFMWTVLLSLMLLTGMLSSSGQLTPGTPAQPTPVPVRTEKLTPDEQKQLRDAKAEVKPPAHMTDARLSRGYLITTVMLAKGCGKHSCRGRGFFLQSPGRAGAGKRPYRGERP